MEKETKNKIIQTYAEDMAKVLESDKSGVIKKIIHGEEESEKEKKILSPESGRNKFFMFTGIMLVILALGALVFLFFKKDVQVAPIEKQLTPIIFTDKSNFLEVAGLKKDEITQTILSEISTADLKNKEIEGIYLTENKKVAGLRKFVKLIKSDLVLDNNGLASDNFLLGTVNKDFFILLKVKNLSDIFDSLRAWENTILNDLHSFFGIELSAETKYLFTKDFEDGIVENRNARILYEKSNQLENESEKKIILMYVFADDNSVIISNNIDTVREVMLRLASSKVKK